MHIWKGAPKTMEIYVTQVPVGTGGLLLSTRYPAGTSFTIKRVFRWFPQLNAQLWRASSVAEVQRADGQAYHFDGRWLTLKVTDPGDPASKALEWLGISIQHARWYNLHYKASPGPGRMPCGRPCGRATHPWHCMHGELKCDCCPD